MHTLLHHPVSPRAKKPEVMNKRESLCYISAWSKSIRVDVSALNKGVKCFTPACKVIIIINDTYNITIRTVINVTIFVSEIRLILWYLEHLLC